MKHRAFVAIVLPALVSAGALEATTPSSETDIKNGLSYLQKRLPRCSIHLVKAETNHNHVFLTCDLVHALSANAEAISRRQYRFQKKGDDRLEYEGEAVLEPDKIIIMDD